MKNKAVIFDFNGTLFWDSEINYVSWRNCIKKWLNKEYTLEQYAILNGRTTYETLENVFPEKLTQEQILKLSNEKDLEYLKVMNAQKDSLSLAPGVEPLIKNLLQNKIKLAIATSAPPSLMVEYEKIFNLSRYFNNKHIVSSDGSLASKPDPAIFNEAIKRLNVNAKNCVVFEDTKSGIISAARANIPKIIAVNSNGSDIKTTSSLIETHSFINSFDEICINDLFNMAGK